MSRKFLHFVIFLFVVFGICTIYYLCYNKKMDSHISSYYENTLITHNSLVSDENILTLALLSDSHLNDDIFPKLFKILKTYNPDLALHAGDLTNFGTEFEFENAKIQMDSLNVNYIALPGDHDIAQTSSQVNFDKFFSYPSNLVFNKNEVQILFLPNFYNFTTLPDSQFNDLKNSILSADIIFTSQPIYVPEDNMFSDKFMASSTAFENLSDFQKKQLNLYAFQRNTILNIIRSSVKPKIIISGDHHRSSSFSDPVNNLVKYHILGSLSKYIYFGKTQISQTSLQSNRFSILKVLKDKKSDLLKFEVKEIEIY